MNNGYPHLMAVINGAEGNQKALEWLEKHNFKALSKVARVGDGDEDAFQWLLANDYKELAIIAKKIQFVKNEIENDNNDPHKISSN